MCWPEYLWTETLVTADSRSSMSGLPSSTLPGSLVNVGPAGLASPWLTRQCPACRARLSLAHSSVAVPAATASSSSAACRQASRSIQHRIMIYHLLLLDVLTLDISSDFYKCADACSTLGIYVNSYTSYAIIHFCTLLHSDISSVYVHCTSYTYNPISYIILH